MNALSRPGATSELVRQLRYSGDEVQWARVLFAALAEHPSNRRRFVEAVLEKRHAPVGRPKRTLKVPDTLTLTDEARITAEISRLRLQRRVEELGRVDFLFRGRASNC